MTVLVAIVIVAVAGYYVSLRIHPLTHCKLCKGSGRHFGTVFKNGAHRRCRKCGGSGRRDRLGVKLFLGGTKDTGIFDKR